MLVSFRGHLLAGIITFISFIFTCAALGSCHWIDTYNAWTGLTRSCFSHVTHGWSSVTLVFMVLAVILQAIFLIYLLISCCFRRINLSLLLADYALIGISSFCLFLAIIVFLIGSLTTYRHTWFPLGYSWILAVIAFIISLLAYGPVAYSHRWITRHGDRDVHVEKHRTVVTTGRPVATVVNPVQWQVNDSVTTGHTTAGHTTIQIPGNGHWMFGCPLSLVPPENGILHPSVYNGSEEEMERF